MNVDFPVAKKCMKIEIKIFGKNLKISKKITDISFDADSDWVSSDSLCEWLHFVGTQSKNHKLNFKPIKKGFKIRHFAGGDFFSLNFFPKRK